MLRQRKLAAMNLLSKPSKCLLVSALLATAFADRSWADGMPGGFSGQPAAASALPGRGFISGSMAAAPGPTATPFASQERTPARAASARRSPMARRRRRLRSTGPRASPVAHKPITTCSSAAPSWVSRPICSGSTPTTTSLSFPPIRCGPRSRPRLIVK